MYISNKHLSMWYLISQSIIMLNLHNLTLKPLLMVFLFTSERSHAAEIHNNIKSGICTPKVNLRDLRRTFCDKL